MNKEILKKLGFTKEVELVENHKCPICGKPIKLKDFKTELDLKEYKISGMCQLCQTKIFGKNN